MGPVEKLGEFIVTRFRDEAIDHADGLLSASWKSPATQSLQAELAQLSPTQRDLVRRVVIASIDNGLHAFLFALGEVHDFEEGLSVVVDGQDVAEISDGLQGEPYGEDGWFAQFSKHGPHPDTV